MGTRGLRKIQIGVESTEGTAVAATTLWRGMGMLEDQQEVVHVEEDIGYLSGVDRTHIPRLLGHHSMEATPMTFEQLPYLYDAGVKTVSGAQDGTGSDYIYTYAHPTTALNTIKTYTIETGDDAQAEEMEGSFVESFELSGVGGEAWMMAAEWAGRKVTNTTFTGGLSLPAVEDALFGKSKLYIDAIGGTIGTTQVTGSFLGASIRVTTGWKFKYSGDGNLYPTIRYFDKSAYLVEMDLTFEHDTAGLARKTAWRAQTPSLVRVLVEGNAVATPGTTYSVKTAIFDFAAKVTSVPAIDEQEGNDILVVTHRSRYNTTAATHASAIIVNELSALP